MQNLCAVAVRIKYLCKGDSSNAVPDENKLVPKSNRSRRMADTLEVEIKYSFVAGAAMIMTVVSN